MNRWFLIATLIAAPVVAQSTLPLPPSGNVTLPLDEYNKLVEQAGQPARKTEAPPLAHAVNSAQLNLVVGNENVTGRILLTVKSS